MQNHSGKIIGERDGLRVIDCANCGYAHLETMPNQSELAAFYENDFWQREKAGSLDRLLAQREWWTATHGDWLSLVEQYTRGRSLLDYGCGYGLLMETARDSGWAVHGIEPNIEAARRAAQFGAVNPDNAGLGIYDCIAATWLLEHMPDPLEMLARLRDHLFSNGVLLAVVPNDFIPIQIEVNLWVKRPFWWIHHTHLNYFTWSSLSNLLGLAGFKIIERLTLYQMEEFMRLAKQDYTGDDALGAELHRRVEVLDLIMGRERRIDFYRKLAREGRGREIVVVARRI